FQLRSGAVRRGREIRTTRQNGEPAASLPGASVRERRYPWERIAGGVEERHSSHGIVQEIRGQQRETIEKEPRAGAKYGLALFIRRIDQAQTGRGRKRLADCLAGGAEAQVQGDLVAPNPMVLRVFGHLG